jgi:hypothetical protein
MSLPPVAVEAVKRYTMVRKRHIIDNETGQPITRRQLKARFKGVRVPWVAESLSKGQWVPSSIDLWSLWIAHSYQRLLSGRTRREAR